jgi:two-component system cell cycle sensor histidine kinase/response regulator CckA
MVPVLLAVLLVLLLLAAWRVLAVMRLNRDLRRYRAFIEHTLDLITVMDADGVVRFASPSARQHLGGAAESVVGRHLIEFVHEDDRALIESLWAEALRTPGARIDTPEFRVRRLDGSTTYLQATGRNLLHDAAVRGVLAHAHDVSDRRAALEALRATEEQFRLAQKMEAVGRLAGGIAHDFNNLLTAIQGYTRLLLEEQPQGGQMRADLEQVEKGAERAALLTRQLLAFSRRQLLQPQTLELNDVVDRVRDSAARMMDPGIDLEFHFDRQAGTVRADASQLEQVVINLLSNARDAMPRGGRITVTTRRVEITEEEAASYPYLVIPGDYAELTVRDEGTGIEPDVLPQIFEPFFTTKELGSGTGLGLSTAYGIIKQSSGYIWVTSQPGAGATFRICLPRVARVQVRKAESNEPRDPRARGETVLLVEDEEAVRRLAMRILQRGGYHVISAPDGRAALDICRGYSGPIHMVMTDVVLPGMNGPDVVEKLRAIRPDLKALFASGYTRDAIMEHGFIDPDIMFLEKPFSPAALTQKVREVLDAQ